MINKLVVIGVGLIGGSLAMAARQRGLCHEVIGVVRKQSTCDEAIALGVVDRAVMHLSDVAHELTSGDVIFIGVPTLAVPAVLEEIRNTVMPEVTVTDGASVKGSVLAAVTNVYGEMPPQVVLGHPIAGSEKSGVGASNPHLYEQHRVILTPDARTGSEHLARVSSLWRGVGAEVLSMPVDEHDDVLAATSHLPHAIAYSLVDTLAHDAENENIFRYAAGGFRDFTRIASSDPTMWHDIMLANRESVLRALDLFVANLARLRDAIDQQDGDALLSIFSQAKAARDHFTQLLAERQSSTDKS